MNDTIRKLIKRIVAGEMSGLAAADELYDTTMSGAVGGFTTGGFAVSPEQKDAYMKRMGQKKRNTPDAVRGPCKTKPCPAGNVMTFSVPPGGPRTV